MKKAVLLCTIAASFACSCADMQEAPESTGIQLVLTAYQEGTPDAKTAVEDGGKQVFWEPGDEIKAFSGSRTGRFTANVSGLTTVAEFTGHLEGSDPDVADIWAVYPYSDEASFDGESITTVIPSVQVARPGTFAQGANVAIAHSSTTSLQFYNVGGGIRFIVSEDGIKSVLLESLNGELISGSVHIGFSGESPSVLDVANGSSCIFLSPQDGGSFTPGVWYYLVSVPGTLENGFRLIFYKDDSTGSLEYNKGLTIRRKTFASVHNADASVAFISNENVDNSIQEFSELISPCVTSDMTAQEQISSLVTEIESNPTVESVEVGESSTSIQLKTGETLIYPYDYPSAFDDPEEGGSGNRQKRYPDTRSNSLDNGYFDASVVIFNLFSDQSGRKNQNKLMENVKYTLENGTYKKSVCYLGLEDFTVDNVMNAIKNNSIIFFSTMGSTNSKYICTGEEYLVGKPVAELTPAGSTHFVTIEKYEDKYKGKKRYALDVRYLMEQYKGPLMYFASCNSLKGDFKDVKARVVGWDGINQCGQAFALIIADYLAGGRSLGAFLKDFTEEHNQTGVIVDPLKTGTKLKYLNDGWIGYHDVGFYESVLKKNMTIVSPVPGSCVKAKSKYTISLSYDNPDPSNIITDGKNCVYENGNRYFLGFDDMSGESQWTSHYLYADKNSKVNYTDKNFGAGVWRITLLEQGPKDSHGYEVGHSFLIMHKGYENNDIEIEDEMPEPDVKSLGASVETQGVLATGVVINRTMDGLHTGFQLYQLTAGDMSQTLSSNDLLQLVSQGAMISSSVEYQGYYGVMLKDLAQGGKYLVRAFATDETNSTYYGEVLSFQFGEEVTPPAADYPIPEAIDLGLSVKWASFNLGASKPEEYGDYFAWGETEPYYEPGYAQSGSPVWKAGKESGYNSPSYKWCTIDINHLTKYCFDNSYWASSAPMDNKTVLDFEDDAAYMGLGDSWRMPTDVNWKELRDNCTYEWTTIAGVNGILVTGPNGNSIFLPAAGYRYAPYLKEFGSYGCYWSSSLATDSSCSAQSVHFYSYNSYAIFNRSSDYRDYGLSIRPVCPKD